jgi:hypothetical protein
VVLAGALAVVEGIGVDAGWVTRTPSLVVTVVVGLGSAPIVVAMATNVLALSRAAAAEAKPVTVPSSWVPETVRRWCRLLACAAVTVRANTLFESTLNATARESTI